MTQAQMETMQVITPALVAAGWMFVSGRQVFVPVPGEPTELWWESTYSRPSPQGPYLDLKHLLLDPQGVVRA